MKRGLLILAIMLVSATALALPRNYRRLVQTLSDAAAVVATFTATFTEANYGAPDGACLSANWTAHWTMDEASGNLTDECGSKVLVADGTSSPAPTYEVAGPNGAGSGVYVNAASGDPFKMAADDNDLDPGTSDFVLEFVLSGDDDASGLYYIVGKADTSTPYEGFYTSFDGNLIRLGLNNSTTNSYLKGDCFNAPGIWGSWASNAPHHYRYEFDRDDVVTFYINGIECGTTAALNADSQGDINNAQGLFLYGHSTTFTGILEGTIYDMRFCKGATPFVDCPISFDNGLTDSIGAATPTFTRASVSTTFNSTLGRVVDVTKAVPAIGSPIPPNGSFPSAGDPVGIYMGTTKTYKLLSNEDLTNATYWTETGTSVVTADQAADPGGGTRADQLDDDDGASAEKVCQTITVTASAGHIAKMPYKAVSGTPSPVIEIDGTQYTCAAASTSEWKMCQTDDASASGTSIDFCIYPAGTTASNTGSIYTWRPQVYQTVTASKRYTEQHLPLLTTSNVTTSQSVLTYGATVDGDLGTLCAWMWENDGSQEIYHFTFDGTHDMFMGGVQGGKIVTAGLADNLSLRPNTGPTNYTWQHQCWTWDQAAADANIYTNKVEPAYVSEDYTWTAGGTYNGNLKFNYIVSGYGGSFYSDVRIYDVALSLSDVEAIYDATAPSYAFIGPIQEDVRLAAIERVKELDEHLTFYMDPENPMEEFLK